MNTQMIAILMIILSILLVIYRTRLLDNSGFKAFLEAEKKLQTIKEKTNVKTNCKLTR